MILRTEGGRIYSPFYCQSTETVAKVKRLLSWQCRYITFPQKMSFRFLYFELIFWLIMECWFDWSLSLSSMRSSISMIGVCLRIWKWRPPGKQMMSLNFKMKTVLRVKTYSPLVRVMTVISFEFDEFSNMRILWFSSLRIHDWLVDGCKKLIGVWNPWLRTFQKLWVACLFRNIFRPLSLWGKTFLFLKFVLLCSPFVSNWFIRLVSNFSSDFFGLDQKVRLLDWVSIPWNSAVLFWVRL